MVEGVTRWAFEAIVYGEHRLGMAQGDFERAAPGCARRWRLQLRARAREAQMDITSRYPNDSERSEISFLSRSSLASGTCLDVK